MIRSWSISIGRIFGIDIRIHLTFLLLAFVLMSQVSNAGMPMSRGLALFFMIFFAVGINVLAHLLLSGHAGVRVRTAVLLPIGGVTIFDAQNEQAQRLSTMREICIAAAPPLANLFMAGVTATVLLATIPEINLLQWPHVHGNHLARSEVWINLYLAAISFLPAYPLAGGRILRAIFATTKPLPIATRRVAALSQAFAMFFIIVGMVNVNIWVMLLGFFLFVATQLEDRGILFQSLIENVHMEEIMLTEFATLSPADTLEDALAKAVHTLQDDFPVVRGRTLVGTISKQSIIDAIRSGGNGYVQGAMNRVFEVAQRDESLALAFKKISARGLTLIPVVDNERLIGIVTLQNLMHSMGLLAERRRWKHRQE